MSDKWESEVSNLIYCFLSNFLRASWERSLGNRKWIFFFSPLRQTFSERLFFLSQNAGNVCDIKLVSFKEPLTLP